ncbi:hypothetical protein [uncultured Clostridium sp.]|uniref:hypothetical protein n=1 Tax=uncultured Clostridium sp. TaxID=59620 RepID=UPI002626F15B|nr:hypothetical protein [uncultured Clostridium sp.]
MSPSFALAINSVVYLVLFLIAYIIISLIISAIRNSINYKRLNTFTKQSDKAIKRQQKIINKLKSKPNKILGMVFGGITAILFMFVVMMPTKYVPQTLIEVHDYVEQQAEEQPEIKEQIQIGDFSDSKVLFDTNIFGQIDKVTHIYDVVNSVGE